MRAQPSLLFTGLAMQPAPSVGSAWHTAPPFSLSCFIGSESFHWPPLRGQEEIGDRFGQREGWPLRVGGGWALPSKSLHLSSPSADQRYVTKHMGLVLICQVSGRSDTQHKAQASDVSININYWTNTQTTCPYTLAHTQYTCMSC